MNRDEIKKNILSDLTKYQTVKSVVWLQKKYKIGFSLAKEIYEIVNKKNEKLSQ